MSATDSVPALGSSAKDFLLHKLTLRVIYIAAAFSTSHLIALAASQPVQDIVQQAGVTLTINDPDKLRTYLTGLLLIGGEFLFHLFHQNVVLPAVTAEPK